MSESETAVKLWLSLKLPHGVYRNYPLPYALVRSAVFTSNRYFGRQKRPKYTERTKISAYGALEIYQLSGEQLDRTELDFLGSIFNMAASSRMPSDEDQTVAINVSENEILASLNWLKDGRVKKRLGDCLQRMTAASYLFDAIGLDSSIHALKFIEKYTRTAESGKPVMYCIHLQKEISKLFGATWTLVNKAQRHALGSNSLAQSLHAFYTSHRNPRPISEAKLRPIMHREGMRTDKWITDLGIALELLSKETTWRCSYDEKSRLVDVKKPSATLAVASLKKPASKVKDGEPEPKLKALFADVKPGPELLARQKEWMAHRDEHTFMQKISPEAVTKKIQDFLSQYGEAAAIASIRLAKELDDFDYKYAEKEYFIRQKKQPSPGDDDDI